MNKHNFKLSWRILLKNKGYSSINIIGLALSMSLAMFIALWIHHESSFDRFHEDGDQIYQVFRHAQFGDEIYTSGSAPLPLIEKFDLDQDIEKIALLSASSRRRVLQKNEAKTTESGYYADQGFLDMFSWGMIQSQSPNLLEEPNTIVISRTIAEKFFGPNWETQNNPIGQTLRLNGEVDYAVTGIFEEVPINSTLQFDFLLPIGEYISSNPGNY
ncbi:MAG: ABC transporter permease, partial [Bacteroidota bacterium]